jgi:hypothetical protein
MKEIFIAPELELICFGSGDLIMTSSGFDGGEGGGNDD